MSLLFQDNYDNAKRIELMDGYIRATGGDGTLLKAMHLFHDYDLPFFGYAKGTVNFLMNDYHEPLFASYAEFPLMLVKIHTFDGTFHKHYAINDVVIGEFNSWTHFDVWHRDNQIGSFNGSGMIVSTSQGSTGINRNNGGTILPLGSKLLSITGMQCNRNINSVIDISSLENDRLEIKCIKKNDSVTVCIDGKYQVIHNVEKIFIESSNKSNMVMFNNLNSFNIKRQR